jgi:hypothetical protein
MTERWMRHLRRSISGRTTSDGDIQLVDLRLSRSTSWLIGKHTAARDAASQTAEGGQFKADLHLPIISDMGGSPTSMPCNQAARKLVSIMGSLVISSRKRSAVGSRTGGSSEWIISLTHLTSTTLYLCPLPCLTLDTIKIELTAPMDRAFRYL